MSNIVYLKLIGEQQGDISDGCGTTDSVGNRWQQNHVDEIFVFSLGAGITNRGKGANLQGLTFRKQIDKSSPLLANAINNNENLFLEFWFYRINRYGQWEKYYYIHLRGASISSIQMRVIKDEIDTETISVDYDYILSKHLISNTEFSYLALPMDDNKLFVPAPKPQTQTLNSASVGRLLAAGGIYNGNIEGFHQTAQQLGGDAPAGYDQIMDNKGLIIAGASVAAGLGLGRLGPMNELSELKNLHVLGKVEGEYSAIAPGPLSDRFAETFSGGVYKEITLSSDTVFYRGGQNGTDLGRFFSYEKPQGVLQARIDKAILPEWPDGSKSIIDSYYETKIPAGTKVYVGEVGYQADIYSGGTEQVVIPAPWEIPGVETLNFGGLK
ncbi:type VI secretion system tube protein TssD [Citrobacter braakii]|uniref:type VI secretion system tube protein TssD n=1 Tax=Citrobacter braakii TaxID=57706 RepID=UPI00397472D8